MIFFLFLMFSSDSLFYSPYVRGNYYLTDNKKISAAEKNGWSFIVFTGYPTYLNSDIYYIFRTPTTTFIDTPYKIFEDPPSSRPPYDGSPVLVIDSSFNFTLHIFWNSERNIGGDPFWWQTDIFYSFSVGSYINFPEIENVSKDTNAFDLFPSATCDLNNKVYVVYWKIKGSEESIYMAERDNFGNWTNKRVTDITEIAENPLIITLENNKKIIFYYEAMSNKLFGRKYSNNTFSSPQEIAKGYEYSAISKNNRIYFTYIRNDSLFLKELDYSFNEIKNILLDTGEGNYIGNPSSVFLYDTLFIFYEKGNNTNSQIYMLKYKNSVISNEVFVNHIGKNTNPVPLITSEGEFFVFFESDRRKYEEETFEFQHIYYRKKLFYTKKNSKLNVNIFTFPTNSKKIRIYNITGRKVKNNLKKGIYFLINKKGERRKCIFLY